jgi:hypothetical protein
LCLGDEQAIKGILMMGTEFIDAGGVVTLNWKQRESGQVERDQWA